MRMSRSILIFGINYVPEVSGNAPYTTGLAEGLTENGWQVRVVTGYPHYPQWERADAPKRESLSGVGIERRPHYVPHNPSAVKRGLYEATWLLASLSAALRKREVNLVLGVVPSLSGAVLARIAAWRNGVPYVLWLQDLMGKAAVQSGTQGGRLVAGIVRKVELATARPASKVMMVAEGFRDCLEAGGVVGERIARVRNWNLLPPPSVDREGARRSFGFRDDEFVAVHSGNMGAKQGLEVVLEAAALAPGIRLVLQGDGNARRSLEQRAEELGLESVEFLPSLSSQELANLLLAADVLLLCQRPSVDDMALPSKLTSYFAAGRTILASVACDSAAALEIAAARVGHLVPAGDSAKLAEAILANRSAVVGSDSEEAGGALYAQGLLLREKTLASVDVILRRVSDSVERVRNESRPV